MRITSESFHMQKFCSRLVGKGQDKAWQKKLWLGSWADLLRNSAQSAWLGWTDAGAKLRSFTQQMVKELRFAGNLIIK